MAELIKASVSMNSIVTVTFSTSFRILYSFIILLFDEKQLQYTNLQNKQLMSNVRLWKVRLTILAMAKKQ